MAKATKINTALTADEEVIKLQAHKTRVKNGMERNISLQDQKRNAQARKQELLLELQTLDIDILKLEKKILLSGAAFKKLITEDIEKTIEEIEDELEAELIAEQIAKKEEAKAERERLAQEELEKKIANQ